MATEALGNIVASGTNTDVDTAVEQLTTDATPCRLVLVAPGWTTGPATAMTDGVDIGTSGAAGKQNVHLGPSNFEGVWIPCSNPSEIYVKALAANQSIVWTAFA